MALAIALLASIVLAAPQVWSAPQKKKLKRINSEFSGSNSIQSDFQFGFNQPSVQYGSPGNQSQTGFPSRNASQIITAPASSKLSGAGASQVQGGFQALPGGSIMEGSSAQTSASTLNNGSIQRASRQPTSSNKKGKKSEKQDMLPVIMGAGGAAAAAGASMMQQGGGGGSAKSGGGGGGGCPGGNCGGSGGQVGPVDYARQHGGYGGYNKQGKMIAKDGSVIPGADNCPLCKVKSAEVANGQAARAKFLSGTKGNSLESSRETSSARLNDSTQRYDEAGTRTQSSNSQPGARVEAGPISGKAVANTEIAQLQRSQADSLAAEKSSTGGIFEKYGFKMGGDKNFQAPPTPAGKNLSSSQLDQLIQTTNRQPSRLGSGKLYEQSDSLTDSFKADLAGSKAAFNSNSSDIHTKLINAHIANGSAERLSAMSSYDQARELTEQGKFQEARDAVAEGDAALARSNSHNENALAAAEATSCADTNTCTRAKAEQTQGLIDLAVEKGYDQTNLAKQYSEELDKQIEKTEKDAQTAADEENASKSEGEPKTTAEDKAPEAAQANNITG